MSYILPPIGSLGTFVLSTPFDTKISTRAQLTCKAIRKISDYLSSSEDPKTLCYLNNGLTEQDYNDDAILDMDIVSLQSGEGQWLYIPAKYIVTFPLANGIPYRSIALAINLPQLPIQQDISAMLTDLSNVVKDHIGVIPIIDTVETSRVIQVDSDKHDISQAARRLLQNNKSDRVKIIEANILINSLQTKIQELELFIKNNHI